MDDVLKGKWNQLRGRIQEEWGDLTDDELDQVEGSTTRLAGLLQEKYGKSKMEAENEVEEWLDNVSREF